MHIISLIWKYVFSTFSYIVYIVSLYYLCISFFGIVRIKDKKNIKPQKVFAMIVAAHNEEAVIQNTVESLKLLNYPKNMYDIFVIADNCSDKTASIAEKSGAIVMKRTDKDKEGKGYALEWMFSKLSKIEKKYDAVAILDADNLVHENFLIEMNKKLCEGYKVVQGYLDSKNPYDTWITGNYSISFWTSNRMYQLSRNNLKLSNQLGGTGFCISTETLNEMGWGATCLTEDLEFTCKLVLNGHRVGWAHNAIIYDEKPLTLSQSWHQRKRWMQGFADVSGRYFFKLMKRAITKLDFAALDCALYSIQPIMIILFSIAFIVSGINYGRGAFKFMSNFHANYAGFNLSMGMIVVILAGVLQFIYTPFILILEKKLTPKIFWYYILNPFYQLTWLPISIQGIIHKNDKKWNHTIHTRSVDIKELEKVN